MSGIRGKDTRPEIFVRRGLHAAGLRFRLHVKTIPGKPDIVLPKHKALVLVQGCFWHGHQCRYFKAPATNTMFWEEKIRSNKQRDSRHLTQQLHEGWRCLIVWECAIRQSQRRHSELDVVALAINWISEGGALAEINENGLTDLSSGPEGAYVP